MSRSPTYSLTPCRTSSKTNKLCWRLRARIRHSLKQHVYLVALLGLGIFHGLREIHKETYGRVGCWLLAVSVFVWWTVGLFGDIVEAALAVLFAVLVGGVILNVLKEELPEERQNRFADFALGASVYAVVLIVAL